MDDFSQGSFDYNSQDFEEFPPLPESKAPAKRTKGSGSKSNKKSSKSKQGTGIPPCQEPGGQLESPSGAGSSYTTARWSHKAYGCQVTPTGSLLEEVLNEKKMALLKSPEVIQFLQTLQRDVQVKKTFDNLNASDSGTTSTKSSSQSKSHKRVNKRKKSTASKADNQRTRAPSSGRHRGPPGGDLNEEELFGNVTEQDTKFNPDMYERNALTRKQSASHVSSGMDELDRAFDKQSSKESRRMTPGDLDMDEAELAIFEHSLYGYNNSQSNSCDASNSGLKETRQSQNDIWSKEASAFSTVPSSFMSSNSS